MTSIITPVAIGSLLATMALGQAQSSPAPASKSDWANLRTLTPGAEIRVIAAGSRAIRGTFQGVSEDALIVGGASGEQTIERSLVRSVALKKESNRGFHMMIGLGVGAAAGLAAGAGFDSAFPCRYMDLGCVAAPGIGKSPSAKEIVTPIGAALGLGVGALLPAGGWREIYRSK